MQSQQKILSVESIRGWACFMVILSHLSLIFYPYLHSFGEKADSTIYQIQSFIHESPFSFFYSGTSAVFIFFVLSGFILTKVALKEGSRPQKILSMSLKRYPRLMIPVLTSCLIAYASFCIFDITNNDLGDWIKRLGSNKDYSLVDAVYSGMIDVFLSGKSAYNIVLWTMKIELIGSFIIYILCLNRMTLKIPLLLGGVGVVTFIAIALNIINDELGLGLTSFFGGYLLSIYGRKISYQVALIIAALGVYLGGAHNTSSSYSLLHNFLGPYTYLLCNFMSGFFIVYAIIFNDKLNHLFSGKISTFMGKVSFSVYLIHIPILSTLGIFLFNTIFHSTGNYNLSAISASILSIIFIYAASLLFYKNIDSKGMMISNYFSNYVINKLSNYSEKKY